MRSTTLMWHERTRGWVLALRAVSMIALMAGAAGSVGFLLRVSHHNNSQILLLLFGIWVLSHSRHSSWPTCFGSLARFLPTRHYMV